MTGPLLWAACCLPLSGPRERLSCYPALLALAGENLAGARRDGAMFRIAPAFFIISAGVTYIAGSPSRSQSAAPPDRSMLTDLLPAPVRVRGHPLSSLRPIPLHTPQAQLGRRPWRPTGIGNRPRLQTLIRRRPPNPCPPSRSLGGVRQAGGSNGRTGDLPLVIVRLRKAPGLIIARISRYPRLMVLRRCQRCRRLFASSSRMC